MAANYDRTARFYDPLSYVVFGKTQVNAQNHFLHLIRPNSRVLIVGGGTGQILEALTQLYPSGLHITYVELSAGMTKLAKQRACGGNQVDFVTADIAEFNMHQPYNAVITSFLFDNFSEPALQNVFAHIHAQLVPGALWLDTDFQLTGPMWQKLLLKTMYGFF